MDRHAERHHAILKRADHLEAGPVADVGESRVAVAAEVALQDAAVRGAVEHGAPGLQLTHAIGRLARVQLRHAPVVDVLPAPHRVGEVHRPVVTLVDVGERGGDAALGHHRMRLAEQRLADEGHRDARVGRRDGRAQAGAARTDDEDVVVEPPLSRHVVRSYRMRQSVQMPIEQRRT